MRTSPTYPPISYPQVLSRFGMDTYRDPLHSSLVLPHYLYLLVVGTALMALNLAIEYDCFEVLLARSVPLYSILCLYLFIECLFQNVNLFSSY